MDQTIRHYSPKEFASIIGVSTSTLRRWEKEGLVTSLRTPEGERSYSSDMVEKYQKQKEYQAYLKSQLSKKRIATEDVHHPQPLFHRVIENWHKIGLVMFVLSLLFTLIAGANILKNTPPEQSSWLRPLQSVLTAFDNKVPKFNSLFSVGTPARLVRADTDPDSIPTPTVPPSTYSGITLTALRDLYTDLVARFDAFSAQAPPFAGRAITNYQGTNSPTPTPVTDITSFPHRSHSSLTNLTNSDDHTQYLYGSGRAGGQTLVGGINANDILTLQSSTATTGTGSGEKALKIIVGSGGETEALTILNNGNIGFQKTNPGFTLDVGGIVNATAIYSNGTPMVSSQWTTTGSNIFYTMGNVGIGTSTPTTSLDIGGTLKTTGLTFPTGAVAGYVLTTDANGVASWTDVSSSAGPWGLTGNNLYPDSTSNNLAIGATDAGSAKLYVNGDVGIGTTAPTEPLHVTGNVRFGEKVRIVGAYPAIEFYNTSGANTGYIYYDSTYFNLVSSTNGVDRTMVNSNGLDILNSGNLRVGGVTTIDSSRRLLLPAGSLGAGTLSLQFSGDTNTGIYNTAADKLGLVAGGTESMTITNGNVGVGTTNPGAKLSVAGAGSFAGSLNVAFSDGNGQTTTTTALGLSSNPSGRTPLLVLSMPFMSGGQWQSFQANGGERGRIAYETTNGIFGFTVAGGDYYGTAPVIISGGNYTTGNGSIYLFPRDTGNVVVQPQLAASKALIVRGFTSQTGNLFEWQNSSSTGLGAINASGNVGIGTTSPSQKLSIAGTGWITYSESGGGGIWYQNNADSPLFQFSTGSNRAGLTMLTGLQTAGSFGGLTTGDVALHTNYSPRLVVKDGGNVGIGTTSPGALLDIANQATITNTGVASFRGLNNTGVVSFDSSGGANQLTTGNSGSLTRIGSGGGLPSSYHTGLTVSPNLYNASSTAIYAYGLNVSPLFNTGSGVLTNAGIYIGSFTGNVNATNAYGLYIGGVTSASANNYSLYSATGVNYFGGNVGIGTTSPGYKFDVSGAGRFTGNLSVGSLTTPYAQTITVAKSGGDYTTIVGAYTYAKTLTPSVTNQILIKIMPGVYSEQLTLDTSYISLVGDSRDTTKITHGASSSADSTLYNNVAITGVSISNLTIEDTVGTAGYALQFTSANSSIRVTNSKLIDSTAFHGINNASSNAIFEQNDIIGDRTNISTGVFSYNRFYGNAPQLAGGTYLGNTMVQANISAGTYTNNNIQNSSVTGGNFYNNTFGQNGWGSIYKGSFNGDKFIPGNTRFYGDVVTPPTFRDVYIGGFDLYCSSDCSATFIDSEVAGFSYNSNPAINYTFYTANSHFSTSLPSNVNVVNITTRQLFAERTTVQDGSTSPALKVVQTSTGNILDLYDNTTNVFSVRDGGNVGIGTTSPTSLFQVGTAPALSATYNGGYSTVGINQNPTTDIELAITGGTGNGQAGIRLTNGAGKAWDLRSGVSGASHNYFAIRNNTDSLNTLVITETGNITGLGTLTISGTGNSSIAGNVGIGTTSPQEGLELSWGKKILINGGSLKFGTSTSNPMIDFGADAGASVDLGFRRNADSAVIAKITGTGGAYFAGNVGIGTTSPEYKLDVDGTIRGSMYLYLKDGGENRFQIQSNGGTNYINNNYYNSLIFQNTGNEIARYNASGWYFTSGNVGIGTTSPTSMLSVGASSQFQVNSSGNIVKLNNVTTSFPTSQGVANSVLRNDGAGILTWADPAGTGVLGYWQRNGTNVAPTTITDSLGIGTTAPVGKFDITDTSNTLASLNLTNNTATTIGAGLNTVGVLDLQSTSLSTGNFLNMEVNGLTSGKGLNLTSNSTALSTGNLASIDWSPSGSTEIFATGDLFKINTGTYANIGNLFALYDDGSELFSVDQSKITNSLPTEFTSPGDVSMAYDLQFTNASTANIKSDGPLTISSGEVFGSNNLTLKTYNQGSVLVDYADSGTTANNHTALQLSPAISGAITTGTRNIFGLYNNPMSTAVNSGGTSNLYGSYISPSSTLATAGATNVYGSYISGTATHAADAGTVNQYGLYIANGTSSTNGTSTKYGLYVEAPTGADTNVAGYFGGNVGIGTTSPTLPLEIAGLSNSGISLGPTIKVGSSASFPFTSPMIYASSTNLYLNADSYTLSTALGTSRVTINSSGNISTVGTLAVSGAGNSSISGNLGIGTTSPTSMLSVGSSSQFQVDSSGRLGIQAGGGTTTNLVVGGAPASYSSAMSIFRTWGASWVPIVVQPTYAGQTANLTEWRNNSGGVLSAIDESGNLALGYTDPGTAVLAINGNVGIGTTSPSDKLEINGNITNGGGVTIATSGTSKYRIGTLGTTTPDWGGQFINMKYNEGAGNWTADDATKVGGFFKLDTRNASYGNEIAFYRQPIAANPRTDASIVPIAQFKLDTGNVLLAPSSGNVGIGTTSPGYKLDVGGDFGFSGGLIDTGATNADFNISGTTTSRYLKVITSTAGALVRGFGSASNSLTLGAGGADQLFLDPSGNVGIGTTSPGAKLEVVDSTYPVIRGVRTSTANNTFLGAINVEHRTTADMIDGLGIGLFFNAQDSGGNSFALGAVGGFRDGADTEGGLKLLAGTNGLEEFMTIKSSGNVGIGTTGPSYLLNVVKNQDAVTRVEIKNTSNTANAQASLSVVGNDAGSLGGGFSYFPSNTNVSTEWANALVMSSASGTDRLIYSAYNTNGNILFQTGGLTAANDRMIIDKNGNVGIGTTSPGAKLHILTTAAASTRESLVKYTVSDAGNDAFYGGNATSVDGRFSPVFGGYVDSYNTGYSQAFFGITNSANDATDTSPFGLVHIAGLVTSSTTDPLNGTLTTPTNRKLFSVGGAGTDVKFVVDKSGNVGIGTTSPTYTLDVKSTGTNIARFTGTNSTGCTLSDGGVIACSSDRNLKKNILDTQLGLDAVMNLRPVEFNWNSQQDGSEKSLGFIAQEVEQVAPSLVTTDSNGYKQLNSIGLIPIVARAIQEQQEILNQVQDDTQQISGWDGLFISIQSIIQSIQDTIVALQTQLGLVQADVSSTKDQVASLSASLNSMNVDYTSWKEAMASGSGVLGASDSAMLDKVATVSSLLVHNKTTTFDLTVLNKLTSGVIELGAGIDGDEINSSGGIRFQTLSQGPIDFMNGKVIIDVDGSITAKHLKLDTTDFTSSTAGTSVLKAGKTTIQVDTTSITSDSLVFITPITLTDIPMAVTQKSTGIGFTVTIPQTISKDLEFQWLVIN